MTGYLWDGTKTWLGHPCICTKYSSTQSSARLQKNSWQQKCTCFSTIMLNPYHVLSSLASLFPHSLSHAKGLSLSLQRTHSIEYMLSLPHIPSLCLPFPRTLFTPSHTLSYTHSPLSLPLTHTHVSPSHSLTISLSLLHAPFSLFLHTHSIF